MKTQRAMLHCLAFCLLWCGRATTAVAGVPEKNDDAPLVGYFSSTLSGEKFTQFERSKKLPLSQVDAYRQRVWEAWKKANAQLPEEPLLPLQPLSEAAGGSWKLPETLEPDAVMDYYYGTKGETKPQAGYPLFVYMHGSGPKQQEWQTGLALCTQFDDAPSVCFIPKIPNEGGYYRWWQRSKQYVWQKLLRQAYLSGDIDPNKVYMFGISEGGYGSQRLASFYADYLAAAGPMAGGEPLKNAPAENCANIGFSLLTGANDRGFYRNILTGYVQEEFGRLQEEHPGLYTHRIELIPGKGHSIDYRPTTPWLKQFTRNPYPTYFCWEDFEMDGWHRRGFYNLLVLERPDEEVRTRYQMSIEDNRITLSIDNVAYETVQKDPNWGIEMKFRKTFTPATKGRFVLYLCDQLVDMKKPVTLIVNGKQLFKGKVKPDVKHLASSCAAFFDPCRVYPAAIEISL